MKQRKLTTSVALGAVLGVASFTSASVVVLDTFDTNISGWAKTANTRPVAPAWTSDFGTSANNTGALNFVPSNSGGADYKNSAVVKRGFASTTLSDSDPATSTLILSFDFRYTGNTGGTASSSAFRFALGTSAEAHAFQFANTTTAANPSFTLYDDPDKLSGTAIASLGGRSPALTINTTTTGHTFELSITRTGPKTADYSVSIDGGAPWTWSLTAASNVTNFNFDRILLATGTDSGTGIRAGFVVDNVKLQLVPEPGSISLLALASLGLLRRRRKLA